MNPCPRCVADAARVARAAYDAAYDAAIYVARAAYDAAYDAAISVARAAHERGEHEKEASR